MHNFSEDIQIMVWTKYNYYASNWFANALTLLICR